MVSGPNPMPGAEVEIDVGLVRRLLGDQHPDLADRPVVELANGWDNVMFRLGDDLTVRVPRRQAAAALIEHEQRWLPALASRLPLPIPAPVRVGRPTGYYPWSWSVLPWFDGRPVADDPDLDGPAAARDLGRFLASLHRAAPADAPANPFRGGPLADRDAQFRQRLDQLGDGVDRAELSSRWERCLAAPPWRGPAVWLHGDLHALNVLSQRGRLVAVIDFGDITAGDPATDLAAAWSILDPADHDAFRLAAATDRGGGSAADDDLWRRAEGWALSVGLAILANSADNRSLATMARRMIGHR